MVRRLIASVVAFTLVLSFVPLAAPSADASSNGVVITEIRFRGPAGGNDEFIELYNTSATDVDISGWHLQGCASATGIAGDRATVPAATTLLAGQHYLFTNNGAGGYSGSVPGDQTYSVGFTDGAGVRITNAALAVIDGVGGNGVGGTQCREGSGIVGMPTTNADNSYERKLGGTQDTDDNVADFAGPQAGTPQNRDAAPSVQSTTPGSGQTDVATNANVSVTFTEPVAVSGAWFSIVCAGSGDHAAIVSGGPTSYTLDPTSDFGSNEACTLTVFASQVSDVDTNDPPDNMSTDYAATFTTAAAVVGHLVISQIYGGGGNSGATLKNDFIELYNPTSTTFVLNGWSVQYASASGTTWQVTPISGAIKPGRYYLVQEAAGAAGSIDLPSPHAVGTIAMSATAGKVALRDSTMVFSGACPTGAIDLVGYGAASCSETAPTAVLSNTTAALRKNGGNQDTDNNSADFDIAAPAPRSTADHAVTVASTTPSGAAIPVTTNISITFSEPATVAGTWFAISCTLSGAHTATVSGGPTTYTLDPDTDFLGGDSCTVVVIAAQVTDQDTDDPPDAMSANFQFTFSTQAPPTPIHEIQGAAHISPKNGLLVSGVAGIVTTRTGNGFWIQDPNPDADDATSEGIFVFTSSTPTVNVGDAVDVAGRVQEFRPAATGLSITELTSPSVSVKSTGNPLPPAVRIGFDRTPPTEVIEDDASPDVETSGMFDPATDGIDFWESLEGMRVDLGPVVVTGPSPFDEVSVLANNGAGATSRTARGGIVVTATDKNPEKAVLRGIGFAIPKVNTGDHFAGPIIGVVGYDFGNFMIEVPTMPTRIADGVTREITAAPGPHQLTIATFNVENLDPSDATFDTMAELIVDHLLSPDIISLEEIQDNDGEVNSGTVDATVTLTKLHDAVVAAGGPDYQWRVIDPVNNQDGGAPGGNIRQAFFFRTDRGVAFVDRPGAGSTTANGVVNSGGVATLQFSPGRIDPTNSAFNSSRKPLAAEFTYNGHHFIAIANHWNSKGGDDPLWGHRQPPVLVSEVQRMQQATIVRNFVQSILAVDPNTEVVVLGDLNDFEFSNPLMTLKGAPLNDLIETLPANERYSYVFEGNSQTLDHILVSNSLLPVAHTDVVHVNSEFWDQASDHDPQVATLTLLDSVAPTITFTRTPANANGWNNTDVTVTFSCADNVGIQSCVGDTTLTAETPGTLVTGTATDLSGNTATASTTVRIDKTAPTFTWTGATTYTIDQTVAISCAINETLSGVDPAIASHCDSASGAASGFGPGTFTLTAAATDRAGNAGAGTRTFTVTVDSSSLCRLTRSLVTSTDVATGLCDKLAAAADALLRGNIRAHDNQMAAFANLIAAQRGKSISDADANLLLQLASSL